MCHTVSRKECLNCKNQSVDTSCLAAQRGRGYLIIVDGWIHTVKATWYTCGRWQHPFLSHPSTGIMTAKSGLQGFCKLQRSFPTLLCCSEALFLHSVAEMRVRILSPPHGPG